MSYLGMMDAASSDVNPSFRWVWWYLEKIAFKARDVQVSFAKIADEMSLSTDTVVRASRKLSEIGVVKLERAGNGATLFLLKRVYSDTDNGRKTPDPQPEASPQFADMEATSPPQYADMEPDPSPQIADMASPQFADMEQHDTLLAESRVCKEEEKEVESTRARASVSRDEIDAKVAAASVALRTAMSAWNEMVGGTQLPRVAINDDLPPNAITAMLTTSLANVLAAIAKVGETPHLRGETGTGWGGATFEWLMRPGKVDHVLRQNYPQFAPRKTPWQQKQSDHVESQNELNALWARMRAEREARGVAA